MIKRKNHEMNMLEGPLLAKILMVALPLAATSILQQLFNSADVAVVGRFAGSLALAAVGANTTNINLFVNFITGVAVGANVLVSSYIGKNDRAQAKSSVQTIMNLALISGILLIGIGYFAAKPLLMVTSCPENVFSQALLYLRIYFVGMPFIVVFNFGAAVLRSIGDTRRPLYALIMSGVINVILNVILVVCFRLDVAGVAIATVTANAVCAGMVVYFLINGNESVRWEIMSPDNHQRFSLKVDHLKQILYVGGPSGLQGSIFSISNLVLQSGINSLGAAAIAGSSTALNYEFFTYYIILAFASTSVTFTSQNQAAGQKERCRRIYILCIMAGMLITASFSAIFTLGGDFFLGLYTTDAAVLSFAAIRLHHVVMLEAFTGPFEISAGTLRGMGHSLSPSIVSILGTCVFRICWMSTVFQTYHNFATIMNVYIVSWLLMGVVLVAETLYLQYRKEA